MGGNGRLVLSIPRIGIWIAYSRPKLSLSVKKQIVRYAVPPNFVHLPSDDFIELSFSIHYWENKHFGGS